MKNIHKYIMLFVMAFAVASCAEDEIIENNNSGKPGGDVQFGLSLHDSRTIYSPEGASSFPIYWSEGDKILVASPQCSRKKAEYGVTPISGQSYAKALTRTGDAGVQWGEGYTKDGNTGLHDFYSIYPSRGASWETISADNVTANLNILSVQSANLVLENGTYRAADMDNVIMYARTPGVKNETTVNLQYTPYSTVLEFQLMITANLDEQGNQTDKWGSVKVMSMTLTAPKGTAIAGDFTLKFNGDNAPVITANGNNNANSIKMEFATQPILNKTNQTLKAKLALIPISGIKNLEGWTVSFEVLEGNATKTKTYKKKLDGIDKALEPGLIHKVTLPSISSETAWEPNMDAWITQSYDYKNIYLTELSLPGAWYAGAPTDEGYQATADVAALWNAGVRAFAVECRTNSSNNPFSNYGSPISVVISGTGRRLTGTDAYTSGDAIRTLINSLATQVKNSVYTDKNGEMQGQVAVLVLSYADGGETGHRDTDHSYFINGVKTEITQSGATNIYDKEITANTTVSDVLGKLIIKINVDDNLPLGSYDNANPANMSFSYNPFLQQLKAAENEVVDYSKVLFSKMYFQTWKEENKETINANPNDFLWCFSSANRTQDDKGTDTTIPTYAQRKTALGEMMKHSKEYSTTHNIWFYFNAGGVQTTSSEDKTTSATAFATAMNPWLLKLIQLKANGGTDTEGIFGVKDAYVESDPSPLGIVMFNQCTSADYNGPSIISEIVYMNNKAKLQRKGVQAVSKANYDSTVDDGGNLISLD